MAASTARTQSSTTTYFGDTVGRWEGDTLVLDSIGFIDTTWIGRGGFFHSDEMHVVEKFTREGDAILYDVTLEDPEVLAEPLVFPTRIAPAQHGRERGSHPRNVATARRASKPKRPPHRFGIRGQHLIGDGATQRRPALISAYSLSTN